jgi:hypothetical protein
MLLTKRDGKNNLARGSHSEFEQPVRLGGEKYASEV